MKPKQTLVLSTILLQKRAYLLINRLVWLTDLAVHIRTMHLRCNNDHQKCMVVYISQISTPITPLPYKSVAFILICTCQILLIYFKATRTYLHIVLIYKMHPIDKGYFSSKYFTITSLYTNNK